MSFTSDSLYRMENTTTFNAKDTVLFHLCIYIKTLCSLGFHMFVKDMKTPLYYKDLSLTKYCPVLNLCKRAPQSNTVVVINIS